MVAGLLPADEQYARNLLAGCWEFPAVPFDFEIRDPLHGDVITTVPLSSRLDVARAVAAASSAAGAWAADGAARRLLVTRLVDEIESCAEPLAGIQALETGLDPGDSHAATQSLIGFCRALLAREPATASGRVSAGASGHVLSWGLPLAEVTCGVLPHLLAGRAAVIKPSLRAPMSAAAFAHLATRLGFPPGVINLVQGTGADAGAALIGASGLTALHVRAGERTLSQATRAAAASGARLSCLRAGGNVVVAGPDAEVDQVAAVVASGQRVHSAGGPLGLPLLCVHVGIADRFADALLTRLQACRPAPLPTEPLRNRAIARVTAMVAAGAHVICGGVIPDDTRHRMGWILPPTVVVAGTVQDWPAAAGVLDEPVGPVLAVLTWRSPADLAGVFRHPRHADGIASIWGLGNADVAAAALPHSTILRQAAPIMALADGSLPASWAGGDCL